MSITKLGLVEKEVKGIKLGDKRLNRRCHKIAKAMIKQPSESIPQICGDWGQSQGAYRFFSNRRVSREELIMPAIESTVERSKGAQEILAIQDTTYLNYTSHKATKDLGPIGTTAKDLQGMVVHTVLGVEGESGEVLGLMGQDVWVRNRHHSPKETNVERRKRERESECWVRGIQKVVTQDVKSVIHVMDREGDIYEVLKELKTTNQRYVIRACRNRLLKTSNGKDYVFNAIRRSDPIGKMTIQVPNKTVQQKRQAVLTLRAKVMTIRPPRALKRKGESLEVHVIEVHEEHPPKGRDALNWALLTSEPIRRLEDCVRITLFYSRRWRIEEYHKVLKTGCKIEDRQLETRQRLESFLGLCSLISVVLLRLRDLARGEAPVSAVLSDVQIMVLRAKFPSLSNNPSARESLRAVARLGGFLARKGDGEPGWITLWRGMQQIIHMEHGFLIAKNILPLSSSLS